MAKVIDTHKEKANAIRNNREKRIKQSERERIYSIGIPVAILLGLGTGVYGYRIGRKGGYLDGVNAGYVKGGQEIIASWREHSEQMRLSRGE